MYTRVIISKIVIYKKIIYISKILGLILCISILQNIFYCFVSLVGPIKVSTVHCKPIALVKNDVAKPKELLGTKPLCLNANHSNR